MYVEHAPPAALAGVVECLWSTSAGDGHAGQRVMPDGAIDIVLAYEDNEVASANVVGAMTTALVIPAVTGRYAGVRFLPGGAAAVLGVDASELTDRQVPLEEFWRQWNARDLGVLLARRAAPPPRDIAVAVALIRRARGLLPVSALGPTLGVSRQHLARRFARAVGVAPKTFARIVRFQTVMRRAQGVSPDWSGLAYELGYVDQSHLVNDFRALAGLTPTAWFQNSKTGVPATVSIGA